VKPGIALINKSRCTYKAVWVVIVHMQGKMVHLEGEIARKEGITYLNGVFGLPHPAKPSVKKNKCALRMNE
jgi:hypothetical protein